jgi:hypothetical protein
LDWAAAYADQLDPLSASPRNPDQGPAPTDYPYPNEDAFKKLLLRVTGFDGRPAHKLTTTKNDRDTLTDDEDDSEDLECD